MTGPICGVCGHESSIDDFFKPPTVSTDPVTGRLGPSKPIRMDPKTGAVCWCRTDEPEAPE